MKTRIRNGGVLFFASLFLVVSFEDILRTARFALAPFTDILVACCISGKLRKIKRDASTEEWALHSRSLLPAA